MKRFEGTVVKIATKCQQFFCECFGLEDEDTKHCLRDQVGKIVDTMPDIADAAVEVGGGIYPFSIAQLKKQR